ncbi:MAG: radical SAM protein, partial [Clostridia bacterium]|nr:radical SAM protein [Clostridia bacterium]
MGDDFPAKNFDAWRAAVKDPENVWNRFAMSVLNECDRDYLKKMLLALGLGAGINGTKAVRANREKYHCNIPFLILLDPTSACNMNCKGCWSAEYGHKSSLSLDEMRSIVSQGTELGTHIYMLTGGEPLIRKDDILTLCRENPNCMFLAYTNATLVDEKFCEDMKELGNLTLAVSIEGDERSNDLRRGEGAYAKSIEALDMLKKHGLIYGISVCYTSQNIPVVTGDEFLDLMVEKGVRFAFYFNYMPVGKNADVSLLPKPDQRELMYKWLRKAISFVPLSLVSINEAQQLGIPYGNLFKGGLLTNWKNWILSKAYSVAEINQLLGTNNLADILNDDFLAGRGDAYNRLMEVCRRYSLTSGWTPPSGT